VATISRLLKIIGLFCKRALYKRPYSAKETYDSKKPTNRSHRISWYGTRTHTLSLTRIQTKTHLHAHTLTHMHKYTHIHIHVGTCAADIIVSLELGSKNPIVTWHTHALYVCLSHTLTNTHTHINTHTHTHT